MINKICFPILGVGNIEKEDYDQNMKDIKAALIGVNGKLGSSWLVGDNMTVADIMVAAHLSLGF